jgi:hypothetical protein
MPRPPDPTLPKCPTHSGSSVRKQGTYGNPPRPRLRCLFEATQASLSNEEPHFLLDGSRTYSLRKHPFPPRATG